MTLTDTGENVQKRTRVFFDSALSHTRRSDASEKREENSVSSFGRFRLWTSFESSPVSVKTNLIVHQIEARDIIFAKT